MQNKRSAESYKTHALRLRKKLQYLAQHTLSIQLICAHYPAEVNPYQQDEKSTYYRYSNF
ncbi:hypothetical protein EXE30_12355 [Acinetobacter halotolerans]|uniref:Uncharacterized protein n=1 Tax=Acinetobacter halotolerans TaxID=1752076 RepID=A0A4Q6XE73_9GAMM|nr:hypothetical protein EXE30_12355 [Acinetobacter halotolerans]